MTFVVQVLGCFWYLIGRLAEESQEQDSPYVAGFRTY